MNHDSKLAAVADSSLLMVPSWPLPGAEDGALTFQSENIDDLADKILRVPHVVREFDTVRSAEQAERIYSETVGSTWRSRKNK
jgi:hypothetical protein